MAVYKVTGIFYDNDCSTLDDWIDSSNNGTWSQQTFDGESSWKFDSGPDSGNRAQCYRLSVGAFGDRVVVKIRLYFDDINTRGNGTYQIQVRRDDGPNGARLVAQLATDGLFIYDGASYNQVSGVSSLSEDQWYVFIFDIDFSDMANPSCDVYIDNELKESNVACAAGGSWSDGYINFTMFRQNNPNQITYVDYFDVGTGLSSVTSTGETRDAVIEGKPLDDLNAVLQGAVTDDVSAIMRSVIASYRGSATEGKPFDSISAIINALIYSEREAVIKGKSFIDREALILGSIHSSINSTMIGAAFDSRESIIEGKSFNDIKALIYGTLTAEDDIDAILKGKYYEDVKAAISGNVWSDIKSIIYGVVWSDRYTLIKGKPFTDRSAVEKGKPYTDRPSAIEGHLIQTDLTFRYNINRASFDYYYALTSMTSTYETVADVVLYEEDSRPIYIYYGYGHEAYEYYPGTETLVPSYSNVPADAEWEIKVYANAVDNREERNATIKELSKVDFDAEIRSAFSKIVDQSYHTFNINLGVAGILDDVRVIMRVKATADRVSWILGKDFPLYLIGTDFGVYSLLTTTRRIKIAEARFAVLRGLVYPFGLLYGILQGVTFNEIVEGIVEGKPFSDAVWGILNATLWSVQDEYGVIRGCINCANDVYSYGYAVEEGRDDFIIWQGTKSSVDKSLNRYEENYSGPWTPRAMLGTSNEGFYVVAAETWITGSAAERIKSVLGGFIFNSRGSVIIGV